MPAKQCMMLVHYCLPVGAHTHHVLAHMAPEEEQTHSLRSEESTPPPHPATGAESLVESPQSEEQPPVNS